MGIPLNISEILLKTQVQVRILLLGCSVESQDLRIKVRFGILGLGIFLRFVGVIQDSKFGCEYWNWISV